MEERCEAGGHVDHNKRSYSRQEAGLLLDRPAYFRRNNRSQNTPWPTPFSYLASSYEPFLTVALPPALWDKVSFSGYDSLNGEIALCLSFSIRSKLPKSYLA